MISSAIVSPLKRVNWRSALSVVAKMDCKESSWTFFVGSVVEHGLFVSVEI